jgi:hypothetical protein
MLYSTQCTQVIFGAAGSGASGSSTMSTRLFAAAGTPDQASGGEMSCPSQVYFDGICPPPAKTVDVSVSVMDQPFLEFANEPAGPPTRASRLARIA